LPTPPTPEPEKPSGTLQNIFRRCRAVSGDGSPSDAGHRSKSKLEPTPLIPTPISTPKSPQSPSSRQLPPSPQSQLPSQSNSQYLQPQAQQQGASARPPSVYLAPQASNRSNNNSAYYAVRK